MFNKFLFSSAIKLIGGILSLSFYILLSRIFTPSQLGTFELYLTIVVLLGSIFSLGYVHFTGSEYSRVEKSEMWEVISRVINSFTTSSIYFSITFLILYFIVNDTFFTFQVSLPTFLAILVAAWLFFFRNILLTILQHNDEPLKYSLFESVQPLLYLFTCFIIYYISDLAVGAGYFSLLIFVLAGLVYFVYFVFRYYKRLKFKFTLRLDWALISNSSPWLLVAVSNWLLSSADRWVVNYFFDLSSVGIYVQSIKLASIYSLVFVSILSLTHSPKIYSYFQRGEQEHVRKLIVSQSYYLLFSALFFVIVFISFSDIVFDYIIGSSYSDSSHYVIPAVLNIASSAVFGYLTYFMIFNNKITAISKYLMLIFVLNLILSFFLAPVFNLYGIIYSTLISYLACSILVYFREFRSCYEK